MRDKAKLTAIRGDITQLDVDAIVNAANEALEPGGGVCGVIHRAAGPGLAAECRWLEGCTTGDARITGGHDLPARFVIHAVGPVWYGGQRGEPDLLASCYRRSLELADEAGAASIAFPAISTGIFGYPPEQAAAVAIHAVQAALPDCPGVREVVFCCFSERDLEIYKAELGAGGN